MYKKKNYVNRIFISIYDKSALQRCYSRIDSTVPYRNANKVLFTQTGQTAYRLFNNLTVNPFVVTRRLAISSPFWTDKNVLIDVFYRLVLYNLKLFLLLLLPQWLCIKRTMSWFLFVTQAAGLVAAATVVQRASTRRTTRLRRAHALTSTLTPRTYCFGKWHLI